MTNIEFFGGTPFRLQVGKRRGWGEASYIEKAIAQELGVETSEISVTAYNTNDPINITSFGTGPAFLPTTTGDFTVQVSYTNLTTGESAVADWNIQAVTNSTSTISYVNPNQFVFQSSNNYFGYDTFFTADDLRAMYVDNTSAENNLIIEVTGAGYSNNGQDIDPSANVFEIEPGVYGIRQEEFEGRVAQSNPNTFVFFTVTDPDTGESFADYARAAAVQAPAGYVPEYTLSDFTVSQNADGTLNNGSALVDFVTENGEGYYRLIGDTLVKIDESTLLTEEDLVGVYYCDPNFSTDLSAQFMLPGIGADGGADVAPNLGETTPPPAGTYPPNTRFEEICTCVDQLPAFDSIKFTEALGDATVVRETYNADGSVTVTPFDVSGPIQDIVESSVVVDGFLADATAGEIYTISKSELEALFVDTDGDAIEASEFLFANNVDPATGEFVEAPVTYDAATETYSFDTTVFVEAGLDSFNFKANITGGTDDAVQVVLEGDIIGDLGPAYEGYDPLNNWKPAVRKEINPGGAAADYLGDELFQNQPSGRLMGLNNRASDSTFGDIEFGAFVMGEAGSFDDGSIAGDQYVGTLVTNMEEGFRWSGNFNRAQRSPLNGLGAMDGALVDTQTGDVLAVYENVMDL